MPGIDSLLDDLCGLGLPDIEFIIDLTTTAAFMTDDLVEETKECRNFKNKHGKGLTLVSIKDDFGLYVFFRGDWVILDISTISRDKYFNAYYGKDFKKIGNKINFQELVKTGKIIANIREPIKKAMEGPLEDYNIISFHLYLLKEINLSWDTIKNKES